jgi:hypothetical protein
MATLVGPARLGRPCLAIVQRGNTEAVKYLRESFDSRDVVEVRWDGRTADRRRVGQGVLPERRRRERRRRPPPTWTTRGFVLVPVNGHKAAATVEEPVVMVTVAADYMQTTTPSVAVTAPAGSVRVKVPLAPGPAPAAEVPPAERASATPAELARLGQVVVLVRAGTVILPSFHDPVEGGWRCGRCDAVMAARNPGSSLVRAGEACTACQAEVVRVVQRPWQHVNWLRLAIVVGVVYLTVRAVWPLVSLML